ncbi:glutamate racemase [Marinospirillum insulare]|uniref:Glutamate racemase n=1 Tax=Marinospirillum insulare TaxID=217169 RepID=A0ABQ5ZX60_9GAMM|nr:glutamate racemase [Marinospirillum insulare]GLR64564.1 glutamate racemase [Marinospirillum insulare]
MVDLTSAPTPLSGPILVFDSGVGGLSVVQALKERLPSLPLVYACDNAAFPYGQKSAAWLKKRVLSVIASLIKEVEPSLIVLACNTASTLTLPELRMSCNLPVVGVVPAIKPAALMTRSGQIGLLATCGTVSRPYTEKLIKTFAADCEIIKVGSNRLVELAEVHLAGGKVADQDLLEILQPFLAASRLDTVVLGCTHFPLLQPHLARVAEQTGTAPWQWIDSGAAIARRVVQLLTESGYANPSCPTNFIPSCWLTAPLSTASQLPHFLQSFGFSQLKQLTSFNLDKQVS